MEKTCKPLIISLLISAVMITVYAESLNKPSPLSQKEARKVWRVEGRKYTKADNGNVDLFSLKGCSIDWKEAVVTEDDGHWFMSVPTAGRKHIYSVIFDNWAVPSEKRESLYTLSECYRYLYVSKDKKTGNVECRGRFIISDQDVDVSDFPTDLIRRSENPILEIMSESDGRLSGLKSYQRKFISPKIEAGNSRYKSLRDVNARITNELHFILRLCVETSEHHEPGPVQLVECPECHRMSYFIGIEACSGCGYTADISAKVYSEHDYYYPVPYSAGMSHSDSLNVVLNELAGKTLFLSSGDGFGNRNSTYSDQKELLALATETDLDSLARHGKTPVEKVLAFSGLTDRGSELCAELLSVLSSDTTEFETHSGDFADLYTVADYCRRIFLEKTAKNNK